MGNLQNEQTAKNGIEPSLDRLIVALCGDYERRERLIREGGLPLRMLSEPTYKRRKADIKRSIAKKLYLI